MEVYKVYIYTYMYVQCTYNQMFRGKGTPSSRHHITRILNLCETANKLAKNVPLIIPIWKIKGDQIDVQSCLKTRIENDTYYARFYTMYIYNIHTYILCTYGYLVSNIFVFSKSICIKTCTMYIWYTQFIHTLKEKDLRYKLSFIIYWKPFDNVKYESDNPIQYILHPFWNTV